MVSQEFGRVSAAPEAQVSSVPASPSSFERSAAGPFGVNYSNPAALCEGNHPSFLSLK